jgi:hypothetical protein
MVECDWSGGGGRVCDDNYNSGKKILVLSF